MTVYDPTDPDHMSPEQRRDEVASILAEWPAPPATARRILARSFTSLTSSESEQIPLDVSGHTWTHGHRVNRREKQALQESVMTKNLNNQWRR